MNLNDPNILLMLFYLTGGLIALTIAIIALPTLLHNQIEKAAKRLNEQHAAQAKG